jgi:hypothetical protein
MSNETKQTAIDIAFQKLANSGLLVTRDYKNIVAYREAKEMEKEQMIDFALLFANSDSVYIEYDCEDCPAELTIERPDGLFELTYGGNK